MDYIKEWREHKKKKKYYFKKVVGMPKHDLENICDKLGLDFSKVKYLSSGQNGDAYQLGDKVLKITNDKSEAKSAWSVLNQNIEGIVKYYSVNQYKGKYVIVMEYIVPLDKSLTPDQLDFCFDLCTLIFDNWENLNRSYYQDLLSYNWDDYYEPIADKMWDLYENLSKLGPSDIHPRNIGINKNRDYVMFDYSLIRRLTKFDQPKILESVEDNISRYVKKITRTELFEFIDNHNKVDKNFKPDSIISLLKSLNAVEIEHSLESTSRTKTGKVHCYQFDISANSWLMWFYPLEDEYYLVQFTLKIYTNKDAWHTESGQVFIDGDDNIDDGIKYLVSFPSAFWTE